MSHRQHRNGSRLGQAQLGEDLAHLIGHHHVGCGSGPNNGFVFRPNLERGKDDS
jgi:hypothetical protein